MCKDESRQAGSTKEGVTQIEVTPEMIEAGLRVLHESGELEHLTPSQEALVRDILDSALLALKVSSKT